MFPLMKLPHTALLNLLSTMEPPEVLFLTTFIPSLRHIARRIQWPQKLLMLGVHDNCICFGLFDKYAWKLDVSLKEFESVDNSKPRRIGEKLVDCGIDVYIDDGDRYIAIQCTPADRANVFGILLDHLFHIFPLSPSVYCQSHLESLLRLPTSLPIGRLDLMADEQRTPVSANELDGILHNNPSLETLSFYRVSDITTNSKILSVSNVVCYCGEVINREILLAFSGHDIILSETKLTTPDVIAFVRHWLDGGYQNLDTMFLLWNTLEFDLDEIKTEFNLHEDRPKKSPARYTRPIKHRELQTVDIFDCTKALDIERESDGQLASIRVFQGNFFFYVWKDVLPMEQLSITDSP